MVREVQDIPPAPRTARWPAVLWYRWPIALIGFVMAIYGGAWTLMLFFAAGGKLDGEDTVRVRGVVCAATPIDRVVNGERMVHYAYTFGGEVAGQPEPGEGKSFARAGLYAVGDPVPVEYVSGQPSVSRIVGARMDLISEWLRPATWLGLLVFPGFLALMLWLQGAFDLRRMLAQGDVAVAEILEVKRVLWVVPGMLSVCYRYRDHRASQRLGRQWVRIRSPLGHRLAPDVSRETIGGAERLPVLHHRRWPQFSRLALPGDFAEVGARAGAEHELPLPPT